VIPFKKILCPTDFSKPSYEALKAATDLALHFAAELWIVHVIPLVPVYSSEPDTAFAASFDIPLYQQELSTQSEKALSDILHQRVPPELSTHTFVAMGDAAQQIIKTAEQEQVDLIVIATHGHTGWGRFMFGSVAEKVVRLSPCPVLTIKAPEDKSSG
jgi:nucleotide-binding universal stress UspA family protein